MVDDKSNLDIELDMILIPIMFGEEGMVKPDGSGLLEQIAYSQNSWLLKSRNKLKSLIEAEVEKAVKQAEKQWHKKRREYKRLQTQMNNPKVTVGTIKINHIIDDGNGTEGEHISQY